MNIKTTWEIITPEKAKEILKKNGKNRSISWSTVNAYARDMAKGYWTEGVGVGISIDENGILRDGQHRLEAIVKSGVSVRMLISRGTDPNGIYDCNRKRSVSDQISIISRDFESVYKSPRYIGCARVLLTPNNEGTHMVATAKEVEAFTRRHKTELDGFFLKFPQTKSKGFYVVAVILALFTAYANGIGMEDILHFYSVLVSGMSTGEEDYPIVAYRNYLLERDRAVPPTREEVSRCQYALKKYLDCSCTKRSKSPENLIWPYPYANERVVTKGENK